MEELPNNRKKLTSLNLKDEDFTTEVKVLEKTKTYVWARLYLNETPEFLKTGDIIRMSFQTEFIDLPFASYEKLGMHKDTENEVSNYVEGFDTKILCLMADIEHINSDTSIPFIRTLFRASRYFEYQIIRRNELIFTHLDSGTEISYYDVSF